MGNRTKIIIMTISISRLKRNTLLNKDAVQQNEELL